MVTRIMTQKKSAAPCFQVDNTKSTVPLLQAGGLPGGTIVGPGQGTTNAIHFEGVAKDSALFYPRDQIIIDSCGVVLPAGFHFDQRGQSLVEQLPPALFLRITPQGTAVVPYGVQEGIAIPSENTDIPLGIFTSAAKSGAREQVWTIDGYLGVNGIPNELDDPSDTKFPQVSMIGVPDSLNGQVFFAIVYLRVRSNFIVFPPTH